ncbi:MAG: hypothetical protein ACFFFB_19170, partial [Candidatus Heimdallarchaeota archaeon]
MDLKDFELIYKENRSTIEDIQKIKKKIEDIVGEKNVSTNAVDILAYTKDTSLITLNWSLEGKIAGLPDFVIWPESKEQISKVLKLANQEKIPII